MRHVALLFLLVGCSSAGGVDGNLPPGPEAGASGVGGFGNSGYSGEEGNEGGYEQGGKGGNEQGGKGGNEQGSKGGNEQGGDGQGGNVQAGAGGDPFGNGGAGSGQGGSVSGQCSEALSGPQEVYAHSSNVLYRVDADTKAVNKVGNLSCGGSVIDIALDKTGNLYGTTFNSLVLIDKKTAACKVIKTGSYPNSLSFVPEGTVFPDKEALVGYVDATYVVIDPVSGGISNKGTLSGGYTSSGDIVSVIGGGTYLTVKGNGCGDCMVRVNPASGDLVENLGSIQYSNVFGLAFWGGQIYGFSDAGEIFTFDPVSKNTKEIPFPNAPSSLSFYGAGSTTCARLTIH